MTNNRELRTNYGTVRNISNKKMKKRKLKQVVAVTLATASIVTIMTLTGCEKNKEYVVPDNQIKVNISMQVEEGDTISDVANKFYTDECEGVYNSISDFEDEIKEQNNINKFSSFVKEGDTIEVPVIIEKENPYYLKILDIQSQINNIQNNNLWVRYTVEYGDRLSTIAEKASGSYTEIYEITNKIASKNNINNKSILNAGQEIWIMNPELGELKSELKNAQEELKLSLTGEQLKK
ncbi:MAG: LysM peptidoglycan-binding domain-containing protein [Bacilli bacterium]|nr:LysM peptidoglycan-binding domain-containing protein [Bacilli bacterium]